MAADDNMFDEIANLIKRADPDAKYEYGFSELLGMALNGLIAFSFTMGFAMIAFSLVLYVTSAGNPDKTKRAWRAFLYGIIGTLVAFATITIKRLVVGVIGVTEVDIVRPVPDIDLPLY